MSFLINPFVFVTAGGGGPSFDETNGLWRIRAASESYADNDLVGTATDLFGNGMDWTATGADRPIFKTNQINGHAAYRFLTKRSFGPNLSGLGLTEIDVFIVVWVDTDPPALGGETGLWTLNNHDGTFSAGAYPYIDGTIYEAAFLSGLSDQRMTVNPTPTLASPRLYRVTAKTGSNNYTMDLDGVNIATATRATLQFPSAPELGNSRNDSAGNSLHGYIAEFFAFSTKCDATQFGTIRDYCNDFYSMSVV